MRQLTLILLFFSLLQSNSQNRSLLFTHFEKKDGLNQSSVNCIYQDSKNYLWIANFGGINRFDGYEMTSYINDFDDPNSIASNSVWTIYETRDGSLWFGTKSSLSLFNRNHDNFTNYFVKDPNTGESTLAIKSLFESKKGVFYVGTEGQGLYIFDRDTERFSVMQNFPKNAKILDISEDSKGRIWVATENLGLYRVDNEQITSFTDTGQMDDIYIWSLLPDSQGGMYVGTDNTGLVYVSFEGFVTRFKDSLANYPAGNRIKSLEFGKDGIIWIGSATEGLISYEPVDSSFEIYQHSPLNDQSIQDNDVSSIHYGAYDVLYVGYYMKGFDKIISTPFKSLRHDPNNPNSLSHDNVYCSLRDSNDMLWFGTFGGGLNRYDPITGDFKIFRNNPNNSTSLSDDKVRYIFEDSNGRFWIGTWGGGLNVFDGKTNNFKRYVPDEENENSLSFNIITTVFEDRDNQIWIGTYGGGINLYNEESNDFTRIRNIPDDPSSLSDDHITSFTQDEKGIIWICTYGGGINSYDKSTGKFTRYLPDRDKENSLNHHNTLHLYKEQDSSFYWLTTLGGGLNKFYPDTGSFMHFTEKDGLSNNSTMGMLKDNRNNYWISTNQGISQFDPSSESFTNYSIYDGLSSDDFNLEAYVKSSDGYFYFGNKKGITFFNPDHIYDNSQFPEVHFTQIKVEDSILKASVESLEIPYRGRLSVDFAAVNPDKTDKINYQYMLSGQDVKWRTLNNVRQLEYTNLGPGNYDLRVRSTNSSNKWSVNYASLKIHVPTPWFMTWWFRILAALTVFSIVAIYYVRKLNKARELNLMLEMKVEERTMTIQQRNIELREEKDKTEEAYLKIKSKNEIIETQHKELHYLSGLKDKVLSIISHDVRTPLNNLEMLLSIFNPDEMFTNKEEMSEYIDSVKSELGKVQGLLDNILLWSKHQMQQMKIKAAPVDLDKILVDILSLYDESFKAKNLHLEYINEIEEIVACDKNVISFVVRNLVANAIKFTPEKGTISVLVSEEKDELVIKVRDTGVGMSKEKLDTLFTDNIQWSKGTDGELGTGLGLTFSKQFAQQHDGDLVVSSEVGNGSEFTFRIPLKKVMTTV